MARCSGASLTFVMRSNDFYFGLGKKIYEEKYHDIDALVCGAGALYRAANAAKQVNDRSEIDLTVFVPCAAGGAGELVDLSGPLHTLITFTINGNNVSGKTHFQPQGISGTGETTGDKYQATGVTQESFKGSFQNGQFGDTFVNNFRIIG